VALTPVEVERVESLGATAMPLTITRRRSVVETTVHMRNV